MKWLCWSLFGLLMVAVKGDRSELEKARILPEEYEFVYGVELTMTGAIGAVSYRNGSLAGLATVRGSDAYTQLMSQWYHILTADEESCGAFPRPDIGETQRLHTTWDLVLDNAKPSWVNWLAGKVGLKRQGPESIFHLDFYQGDESTQVITDMLTDLARDMFRKLSSAELLLQPERPYVEIALPAWFFKVAPVFPNDPEPESADLMQLDAKAALNFTQRISTAAHRAGFRRSVEPDAGTIMLKHARGESFDGPIAAPKTLLDRAIFEPCEGRSGNVDYCFERGAEQTSGPAVVIDWDGTSAESVVTLWVDKMSGDWPERAQWSYWTLASEHAQALIDRKKVFEALVVKLDAILDSMGASEVATTANPPIVLTGSLWSYDSTRMLHEALRGRSIQYDPQKVDEYQAALGTAEYARYTQRSYYVCSAGTESLEPEDFLQWQNREL